MDEEIKRSQERALAIAAERRRKRAEEEEARRLREEAVEAERMKEAMKFKFSGIAVCHEDLPEDRIRLSGNILADITDRDLSFPLFFELEKDSNKATVGVFDFGGDEHAIALSTDLFSVFSDGELTATYVTIPKAQSCTLATDSPSFLAVPNHADLLAAHLRAKRCVLSVGDVINLPHHRRVFSFTVAELTPPPSASLIDTDLTVKIIAPDALQSPTAAATLSLRFETPSRGSLPPPHGGAVEYRFDLAQQRYNLHFRATVSPLSGAVGVYVYNFDDDPLPARSIASAAPSVTPRVVDFDRAALPPLASAVRIVVEGGGGCEFDVVVAEALEAPAEAEGGGLLAPGMVRCAVCGGGVPSASADLHALHCARNFERCGTCGAVLKRSEAKAHTHCDECGDVIRAEDSAGHKKMFHSLLVCDCGATHPLREMRAHRKLVCPFRTVTCRFCGVAATARSASDARDRMAGLCAHEGACGSRTGECDVCGQKVMLKLLDAHTKAYHS